MIKLAHLSGDRHRSHARTHASRYLSTLPLTMATERERAVSLISPEPVRSFESAQSISNERSRVARVVCVCVARSAIAIASCAMLWRIRMVYAWQVTTSRGNLRRRHRTCASSSFTPSSCSSTPRVVSAAYEPISSSPLTDDVMRASARATRESACCERQPRGNGNERGNVRCYSSERCRLCADGVSRVNFL